MNFSILRRVVRGSGRYSESCFSRCSYVVRQNASPIWSAAAHRFFSSKDRNGPVPSGNAEKVKTVLKEHGFDDAHLSTLARRAPFIFTYCAKDNIQPKLEFFYSIGVSRAELPKFVLNWAVLLSSNLEKQIMPCYEYLISLSIRQERLIRMLKYRPGMLVINVKTCLSPNVELLKGVGVPMSSIASLVGHFSPTISRNHTAFKTCVDRLVAMGMNPLLKMFVPALHVMCSIREATWERKLKLFTSFGLSEDDIMSVFKKQPMIMALSEKKLGKGLEFFRNELGLAPDYLVRCPVMLSLSFERRVRPRCRVLDVLLEKRLVKKLPYSSLLMKDEMFLRKFIFSFKDDWSELMEIYSNSTDKPKQWKADRRISSD